MVKILTLASAMVLTACDKEDPQQFIHEGRVLFERGDLESARVQFKNALQINPKLAEAYYGLALLDEKASDLTAVRANLQQVIALDPNHVDAQAKLGLLLSDQVDKAKEQLAVAKKLDPENINTVILDATLQAREGNKDEALRLAERVLAKDASNVNAVILRTFILASDKRYDEALTVLEHGIQVQPDNAGLGLLKVRIHREQGKFDDVVRDYEELLAKHPDDKKLRHDQIQILTQLGKLEQVEKSLRDAVAKNSADAKLKLDLVNFIEPRDAVKAETELKNFIAADPKNIQLKTRLAGYYIGHSRNSDAEALLKEIVAADPTGKDGLTAKVRLAEQAWARNDKTAAEDLVEAVIKADAGNSGALLFRATTRLSKRDLDGAVSDLRIVLRDQPNSDQAMVLMGRAYAMKGERELAESHWSKAIDVNPSNFTAVTSLVSTLLDHGDNARAEELLNRSLKANPDNPAMLELLVQSRAAQKNWIGAEAAVNELKKHPQAVLAAQLLEGMLAASQGRHQDAIRTYQEVLAQKPGAMEALLAMARSYEAAGQRSAYFTFLKGFIKQNPNSIPAYNALGMAYAAEKKWSDASQTLQVALTQDPKAIATYKLLAGILIQQGKAAEVAGLYRKGLEESPDNPELMLELAKYYDASKQYKEAIAAYSSVLEKYPSNDEVANNLAYLLVESDTAPDRFERAMRLVERFKDSPNPYFFDTYGWVMFKAGRNDQSIAILQKAVSLLPNNPEFHYHLGEANYATGDKNAAKLELEKSLALAQKAGEYPALGRAKDLLKQMGG